MGMYSHLIHKLPKVYGGEDAREDPKWQEKVSNAKQMILKEPGFQRTGVELARRWTSLRLMKDAMKAELKTVQLSLDAVTQLMDEQFDVEGITSMNLANIGSVRIQLEPYAKVVDAEQCRQWALKQGLERDMKLGWMKLNALTKALLLEGDPEPDGVEAKALVKPVFTKEK